MHRCAAKERYMNKKPKPDRKPEQTSEPAVVEIKPHDYQPSKAELEEEINMPGMSLDEVRKAFLGSVKIVKTSPE